ncbi:hypothetical protein BH10PSE2_BH10PSE2_20530 [soil metagenome]
MISILGIAACASGHAIPRVALPVEAAAPSPVAGYDWFYDDGPDEVRLTYGVESSDDVRLSLACRPGSSALSLTAETHGGTSAIVLESGGETERFTARSEPSALSDGEFLTADGPSKAPVFLRFRRLGWLAIWEGETRTILAAHPQSTAGIERFFTRCA